MPEKFNMSACGWCEIGIQISFLLFFYCLGYFFLNIWLIGFQGVFVRDIFGSSTTGSFVID